MALLTYARLLRLPNVFTAWADIGMALAVAIGTQAVLPDFATYLRAVCLLLASGCLYCAGMVWNDYFDLDEDRRDRPFRPLASGAISLALAKWIGLILLVIGLGCASLDFREPDGISISGGVVGICLIVAILAYDARIKRTAFGPVAMASCRFLNVLLGLTIVDVMAVPWVTRLHIASAVGVYIFGVTWFARTEEKRSEPRVLRYALGFILLALAIALAIPVRVPAGTATIFYPYLLVGFALVISIPALRAIRQPTPSHVQAAVKRCILGLLGLDAILATAFVGISGLLLLLLLPPALWIGKWVYST